MLQPQKTNLYSLFRHWNRCSKYLHMLTFYFTCTVLVSDAAIYLCTFKFYETAAEKHIPSSLKATGEWESSQSGLVELIQSASKPSFLSVLSQAPDTWPFWPYDFFGFLHRPKLPWPTCWVKVKPLISLLITIYLSS